MTINPQIELHVQNFGIITLELNAEKAPKTVANFLHYLQKGHYDGTIFHRVISGFMIQGGGHEANMSQKSSDATVENEAHNGLKNDHYTIAMARTSAPHSASAQFFINTVDNHALNYTSPTPSGWGYAVFGKVIKGFEVVDAIGAVKTGRKSFHDDVPKEEVLITKAILLANQENEKNNEVENQDNNETNHKDSNPS